MNSNIGKTFNNKNTQYTILEQVVTNAIDNYTVSLLVRNNVEYPSYVVAQGLNLETCEWDSGNYLDCMEDAFFAMEQYRRISRNISKTKAPSVQHVELLLKSMKLENCEELVKHLTIEARQCNELNKLLQLTSLNSGLFHDVSFQELTKAYRYCYGAYKKSQGVSFHEVTAFFCTLIFHEVADIATLLEVDKEEFARACYNDDYEIGGLFKY